MSEMGRQNGNVALVFAARHDKFFALRKNPCIGRRLGRVANLLRCVHLDAVMHNRSSGRLSSQLWSLSQIGIASGVEPVHDGCDYRWSCRWFRAIIFIQN
jgi:hypothetical protein